MRARILLASWFMITGLALGTSTFAAPSLPITRPPVYGPDTGPAADTNSIHGQWFSDINTNQFEVRTHEFHDNTLAQSGGTNEHLSIAGYITDIRYGPRVEPNPYGPIIGFSIMAIVSNDTPSVQTNWPAGINSHTEHLNTTQQWDGTFYNAVLTAEFARNNKAMEPEGGLTLPYKPDGNTENAGGVIATNEDLWAWYCWAPSSDQNPKGGWFVPAWKFGDIPNGQGATRVLNFSFQTSLPPNSSLYASLKQWETDGTDVFANRSYSLKIKSWVSNLLSDSELDNLLEPESDVSVFHNILPTLVIAAIRWDKDLAKAEVSSLGRIGIGTQILQSCSDLIMSNWIDQATNPAPLPAPYTNLWENLQTAGTSTFYRIIQE